MGIKSFAVGEIEFSFTFFVVIFELAFILYPVLLYILPISVIVRCSKDSYFFVIQDPMTTELIVFPLTFISDFLAWVVEGSFSMHFVFEPFSNIFSTFTVKKGPVSMPFPIKFGSFIAPSCIILRNMH
jgi:predicted neutral ceramidase superfamily lipid hydrolase